MVVKVLKVGLGRTALFLFCFFKDSQFKSSYDVLPSSVDTLEIGTVI